MAATAPLATRTSIGARPDAGGRGAMVRRGIVYAVYTLGLVLVAGPFLWMLAASFKSAPELHRFPPTFLPAAPTLDNYRTLLATLDFPLYFLNSVVVALCVVAGNLLFCSMLGYALTKLQFAGRDKIFLLVMGTLMVPSSVTLVPLFVLMSALGLVNTYAGLILPYLVGPFGVFLMRQFISGIPDDLLEAARVDGAGEFRIFRSVVMPLCRAPLATLGIFTFLTSWNNFLWPLVVSTTERMYTLPVAVATFSLGQRSSDYGTLMAGSVLLVTPVLVVFLLLQRYFTRGIAMTGIKG
jgi:multiple sugar transport system permease protein